MEFLTDKDHVLEPNIGCALPLVGMYEQTFLLR